MTDTETWLVIALAVTLAWTASAWITLVVDASPIARRETNMAFATGPLIVAIAMAVFIVRELAGWRRALTRAWRDR